MPLNRTLEENLDSDPEASFRVVVTLARGAEGKVAALGLAGAHELAPGIVSASLSAAQIRDLVERQDVEGIDPDEPVHALS